MLVVKESDVVLDLLLDHLLPEHERVFLVCHLLQPTDIFESLSDCQLVQDDFCVLDQIGPEDTLLVFWIRLPQNLRIEFQALVHRFHQLVNVLTLAKLLEQPVLVFIKPDFDFMQEFKLAPIDLHLG